MPSGLTIIGKPNIDSIKSLLKQFELRIEQGFFLLLDPVRDLLTSKLSCHELCQKFG